jgi:hypothetical protein
MDECEELVRTLATERFTQWKPPSPIGDEVEATEHPPADVASPTTSVTARYRARINNDETSITVRSDQ